MNMEERLNIVADRYRNLGFAVVLHPKADDLPPFAKDFKVQVLATKGDRGILTIAKANPSEFEADYPDVERYAEITERQPGWKLEVLVLGADVPTLPEGEVRELADDEISRTIAEAERMLREGFPSLAVIAAWAVLEAAMRRRLATEERPRVNGTSPRTMLNELFSGGGLSNREFRDLEGLYRLRSIIVHGFAVPQVPNSAVEFLLRMAKQLIEAPTQAKQTA